MSDEPPEVPVPASGGAPPPELACYRKHQYASERDAYKVAARIYRDRGVWLRAYLCPTCQQYHLTHKGALPPPNANWRPPEGRWQGEDTRRSWRRKRGDRRDHPRRARGR